MGAHSFTRCPRSAAFVSANLLKGLGREVGMRQHDVSSLAAVVDSLIAVAIAVIAVVWARKQQVPDKTVVEFLAVRLTMLNASFVIVFAVLWKTVMGWLGLFRGKFVGVARPAFLNFIGCSVMTALLGIFLVARRAAGPLVRILVAFLIVSFVYEMARILIFSRPLHWSLGEPDRVIVVGSGRRASKAWRELRTHHHGSKYLIGFLDDRDPAEMPPDIAARYLGCIDVLPNFLLNNVVDELILAAPLRSCYEATQRAVSVAEGAGVRVVCLSDCFSLQHQRKARERARLFVELVPKNDGLLLGEAVKRALDVFVALAGLVLLAPLYLLLAISIKLTSPGPVFFVQERYGLQRQRFHMWKFRSMVRDAAGLMAELETCNEANGPLFKIKRDPRITPLGVFLRRTSLDELPQLLNVLLGDMSLVGPRPMSLRDVSRFSETELLRRFSVRPGITGSWQVGGRSSCSSDQWIALDLFYVDNWSLFLDLRILARTIPAVFRGSGAM